MESNSKISSRRKNPSSYFSGCEHQHKKLNENNHTNYEREINP